MHRGRQPSALARLPRGAVTGGRREMVMFIGARENRHSIPGVAAKENLDDPVIMLDVHACHAATIIDVTTSQSEARRAIHQSVLCPSCLGNVPFAHFGSKAVVPYSHAITLLLVNVAVLIVVGELRRHDSERGNQKQRTRHRHGSAIQGGKIAYAEHSNQMQMTMRRSPKDPSARECACKPLRLLVMTQH